MPGTKLTNECYEVNILIRKSLQSEVETFYNSILKLVLDDKPIPAKLFKKLLSYFDYPELAISEEVQKKATQLSAFAIEHFKNNQDYNFTGKSLRKPPLPRQNIRSYQIPKELKYRHYSLDEMIFTAIRDFLLYNENNSKPIKGKKEVILFFFSCIEAYSKQFNKEHLKQLKPYRKKVIAGVLTQAIGITVVYKPMKFKNENIHQQTRHAFLQKSYKKKSIKKKKP